MGQVMRWPGYEPQNGSHFCLPHDLCGEKDAAGVAADEDQRSSLYGVAANRGTRDGVRGKEFIRNKEDITIRWIADARRHMSGKYARIGDKIAIEWSEDGSLRLGCSVVMSAVNRGPRFACRPCVHVLTGS